MKMKVNWRLLDNTVYRYRMGEKKRVMEMGLNFCIPF